MPYYTIVAMNKTPKLKINFELYLLPARGSNASQATTKCVIIANSRFVNAKLTRSDCVCNDHIHLAACAKKRGDLDVYEALGN